MKKYLFLILGLIIQISYGQNNYLTEVEGTNYVIAFKEDIPKKIYEESKKYLLFINTLTGEKHQIDFTSKSHLSTMVNQIKIDELNINKILLVAKTIDLDGKKGIDWGDPTQLFILSVDGTEKIQITEDNFFVKNWKVNKTTGVIVIIGCYDSNNNGKLDKKDKNTILLYDLKNMTISSLSSF